MSAARLQVDEGTNSLILPLYPRAKDCLEAHPTASMVLHLPDSLFEAYGARLLQITYDDGVDFDEAIQLAGLAQAKSHHLHVSTLDFFQNDLKALLLDLDAVRG